MRDMVYEYNDSPGRTYLACRNCGSRKFYSKVIKYNNGIACEIETRCDSCDNLHLYWAYGHFDPKIGLQTIEEEEEHQRNELRKRKDLWGIKQDRSEEEKRRLIEEVRKAKDCEKRRKN